ncbi:MAG: hypothetical protein R2745_01705 [Vicinamibacterales bacterium]
MHDLTEFRLSEALLLGADLRRVSEGATSLEAAAQRTAAFFCEQLRDRGRMRSACVLARCYKTHAFGELPADLQRAARGAIPGVDPQPMTRCLTLLGTSGDLDEWCDRRRSVGHRAIPLSSEAVIQSLPMIAELTRALGVEAGALLRGDSEFLLERDQRGFNVFHVARAEDSPFVPAQDSFVRARGVRSVVGFGFTVPPADIFTVILFTRVPVDDNTAALFKTLALNLKLALLPLAAEPTFGDLT